MIPSGLDWAALWRLEKEKRPATKRDSTFWDRRAPEFARHAGTDDYADRFMDILRPEPDWRVLDIGSGAGTLAIPLAGRVHGVTALDYSIQMLSILGQRCAEQRLSNIQIIHGSWEDEWHELGIDPHDVAIASRSLGVKDLSAAISKLNRFARKRVVISAPAGDGPLNWDILEAVGRGRNPGPDYIYVYNYLHQIGIHANVSIILHKQVKRFENFDQAFKSVRWMVDGMTEVESERLRLYLENRLVRDGDAWRMPEDRIVRWAVIWWDRE